jgi:hypothetical protein
MTRKQLLAKIKKCLSLAASANENEAAAALAKARELMDANGVDEAELKLAGIEEATARASRTVRPPMWETYLSLAVTHSLGVISFIDLRGDRTFVGKGASAEIATYAFTVLFRLLKRQRAQYVKTVLRRCGPARKRQRADVFSQAWAYAVQSKIKELMPEQPKDETLNQYLIERHPGVATVSARTASTSGRSTTNDFANGFNAGSNVDIVSGIGAAAAPKQIA